MFCAKEWLKAQQYANFLDDLACEQAFGRAGNEGEGKASPPFPCYFSPNREPVHRLLIIMKVFSYYFSVPGIVHLLLFEVP